MRLGAPGIARLVPERAVSVTQSSETLREDPASAAGEEPCLTTSCAVDYPLLPTLLPPMYKVPLERAVPSQALRVYHPAYL